MTEDLEAPLSLLGSGVAAEGHNGTHVVEPTLLQQRMKTGTWLAGQTLPELEWVVPALIPEGLTMLCSPPKTGKSWLISGLFLGCAYGGQVLNSIDVTQRPTLLFALEDGNRRLKSRWRAIQGTDDLPDALHYVLEARSLNEIAVMTQEFLELHPNDKPLIGIDTLGKVKPSRQGEESFTVDYSIGSTLKSMVDKRPGSALIVVHHTRKAGADDYLDTVSGTNALAGSCDSVLVLARKRQSSEAILSVTGRDVIEAEYALTTEAGIWSLDGKDLEAAAETARTRRHTERLGDRSGDVLRAVETAGKPVSPKDIAEKVGIDNDTAGKYLRRLADAEKISKAGRGLYKRVSEASERPNGQASVTPLFGQADTSDTDLGAAT